MNVRARLLVLLSLAALSPVTPSAAVAEPVPIAVFDVQFINTSLEPTRPDEQERTRKLGEALRDALAKSGAYRVVDLTPIRDRLASSPDLRSCAGCVQDLADKVGAKLAAVSWVQKVSNLILNINVQIEDAATGEIVKGGSVDIRGNTDETWDRGLRFLLEEHIFGDRH